MPSRWDSGIIVWRADGQMQVLKEGVDGVSGGFYKGV